MKTIIRVTLSFFLFSLMNVLSAQDVSFTQDETEGCDPLEVNFSNNSIIGDYYIWVVHSEEGMLYSVTSNDLVYTFTSPGHYQIELSAFNSTDDFLGNHWGYVYINGADDFWISSGTQVCPGEKIYMSPVTPSSWLLWDFDDGTSADFNNPHVSYPLPGTYTITLYIDANCGIDTVEKTIEVTNSAIPEVGLQIIGANEVCINDNVEFSSEKRAETYLWDFDDGGTSNEQKPTHAYVYPGTKVVTLEVTNLCGNSNSASKNIYIGTNLPANAGFYFDSNICPNGIVGFSPNSLGTYLWDFGDGGSSVQKNPQYIYQDTGVYIVQLTLTNGCGNIDVQSQSLHVQPDTTKKPNVWAYFNNVDNSETDTIVVCTNEEFSIRNDGNESNGLVFEWNRGDGTKSYDKDLIYEYSSPGFYEITLTATNNCMGKDSLKKWVNVDPTANPNSELMTFQDTICPGEMMFFADMQSNPDDNNYLYSIWFGNGDSLVNMTDFPDPEMPVFTYVYDNPGVYNYTFTVTNLCGNSLVHTGTITVDSDPDHYTFYVAQNSTTENGNSTIGGCPDDEIEFMIFGGVTYEWHFGDGTTSTLGHVYHTYSDTGSYNAFVIATNGCGAIDTVYSLVSIVSSATPNPWFDIYPYNGVCANDSVLFYYPNNGANIDQVSFFWDFGDGDFAETRNAVHVYDAGGEYFVKLVVSNGCGADSSYRIVNVETPIVDFDASSYYALSDENVSFTNLTTGASSFSWDFGDGTSSTQNSPTHSWAFLGQYDITLTATSVNGCTNSLTKNNFITVSTLQISDFVIGNETCFSSNNGFIDIAATGGYAPYAFNWSNGFSTSDIGGLNAGSYSVTITDDSGLSITQTFVVNQPSPLGGNIAVTDIVCFGSDNGELDLTVIGGTAPYTYIWSNGSSQEDQLNLQTGTYSVTVNDVNGCSGSLSDSISQPVNVFISIIHSPVPCGASDGKAYVSAIMGHPGPFNYEWNTTPPQYTDTLFNVPAGTYNLTVSYGSGCQQIVHVDISNFSPPNFDGYDVDHYFCSGESDGSIVVYCSGIEPLTYQWSSGSTSNLATGLGGGFHYLTVTDAVGCKHVNTFEMEEPEPISIQFVKNNPICYNGYTGNAKAIVSGDYGGLIFNWSNGTTTDSIIYRPAGTYSVTVSDWAGCSAVGSVILVNPPQIQLQMHTTDVTFLGMSNGIISTTVLNAQPLYNFVWSNGATTYNLYNLEAGMYSATLTDANGCTATNSAEILEPVPVDVIVTADGPTTFCYGNSVNISAGLGYNYYNWSTGVHTSSINVYESGTYYVTVVTDESYGVGEIEIVALHPYSELEICLVTVDTASGHNVVAWEKPDRDDIVCFNIYKETTVAYDYDLVATIPYDDLSGYLDEDSDPNVQSYRYKISVIDTCGNESALSDAHKTMHLTVSTGIGVYNLIWEDYEGFPFGSYLIYRGNSPETLIPFAAIASSITTYTDYASILPYYYQIAVLKDDTCFLTGGSKDVSGPYSQSVSNLEDNGISVDVSSIENNAQRLIVFPNPAKEIVNVMVPEDLCNKDFELRLTDVAGKVVYSKITNTVKNDIDVSKLNPGVYFVEVMADKILRGKLVVGLQ